MTDQITPVLGKRPYDRTSHILIVDDDDTLLKFFKIHLNKFFSRVLVVENGKQALDAIKEKEIDIVLSDVRMPKVDGLQLMQKIRKAHPSLPILLISGEPMADEQQVIINEADGFLAKPFSVDQLNDFIHFGSDLRVVLKEMSELLKDPKKVRKALASTDKELKKLTREETHKAACEAAAKWQKLTSSVVKAA